MPDLSWPWPDAPDSDPWWADPRLAFAEGARAARAGAERDALELCAELYGPWRFDAEAVVRGLQARGRWPLEGRAR